MNASSPPPRRRVVGRLTMTALLLLAGTGCQKSSPGILPIDERIPPETVVDARPAAFVDGTSVSWGEMRDALTEAAGADVLRDLVLERRIAEALDDADIFVPPRAIEAEQDLLLETLDEDPDVAARLLATLRDRRDLGPTRFRALLRRNAGLRALVRDQVSVTDGQRRAMFDVLHGPKRRVLLIVTPTLSEAEVAAASIDDGALFAATAAERSTDASAARGGLIEPIARLDPAFPLALREAIFALPRLGAVSDPILLDDGAALVQLVELVPGDDTVYEDVVDRMDRLVRLDLERRLMDARARQLVRGTAVTPVDDSLRDAWSRFLRERERAAGG